MSDIVPKSEHYIFRIGKVGRVY